MKAKQMMVTGLCIAGLMLAGNAVYAAGQYGPGVTDTEIKIGNTNPYSGPASSYGINGKVHAAFFNMINEKGGINGRKINYISRDDSYSPPKTVEQARQLVEQDKVFLMFAPLGTPSNMAIHGYLNESKVPQLFVATGADQWNDPKHFPWTMMFLPSYGIESHIYANYILKNLPNAKIAVLYQNDDYGKDYLNGLRAGLGDKAAKMIVATQSYETTDPTVDQQVVGLDGHLVRLDQTWVFDPQSGTWTRKADIPAPGLGTNFGSAARIGNQIYLFGGVSNVGQVTSFAWRLD